MPDKPKEADCLKTAFGGQWNADLNAYQDIQAVSFAFQEDLDHAIARFWDDPELQGAPRLHVGGMTMFMPAEASNILSRAGIPFAKARVVSDGAPTTNSRKKVPTVHL